MRILITAIGSMSAECAIRQLKNAGNYVVECDIYPGDWHYETTLCDDFLQAPFATKQKRSSCELRSYEDRVVLVR